jgi:hypothetical protein
MKLENNWRYKTLENLEKEVWGISDFSSRLVTQCSELRKIPLNKFTVEDMRIMISQQFSLDYLVPLSIDVLSKDIFAEGDLFEGDLLNSVLSIETGFWKHNKLYWEEVHNLIKNRWDELNEQQFDADKFLDSKPR